MRRTNELQGRRLPDHDNDDRSTPEMEPGDFVKLLNSSAQPGPTNLTGKIWFVMTPNGLQGLLIGHTVREEDDGSITVKPGDGSSNSILIGYPHLGESWHGYITRGLWWSLS